MALSNHEIERHVRQAAAAFQGGRLGEARRLLEAVTATGQGNIQIWLMLAATCAGLGDLAAAEPAADAVLESDPHVVRALLIKGDARAENGANAAAIGHYKTALEAAAAQPPIPALTPELDRVRAAIETLGMEAAAKLDAKLADAGLADGPRSLRFQQSLDITSGRKDIYFQNPTDFFFAGLPQVQYFDPADFDWATHVETATDAIRSELQGIMSENGTSFQPYIHSNFHKQTNPLSELMDKPDWSALFLVENGKRNEGMIARCPLTWAALAPALAWIDGASPTVMFSLLRAGARIAPHTGMLNTRLICHLPLVVPPDCGFRVGNEVRSWKEGELLIFDDTIEHEAWNRSDRDRVVLIFDIWRPELNEQERREVTALLRALQ